MKSCVCQCCASWLTDQSLRLHVQMELHHISVGQAADRVIGVLVHAEADSDEHRLSIARHDRQASCSCSASMPRSWLAARLKQVRCRVSIIMQESDLAVPTFKLMVRCMLLLLLLWWWWWCS